MSIQLLNSKHLWYDDYSNVHCFILPACTYNPSDHIIMWLVFLSIVMKLHTLSNNSGKLQFFVLNNNLIFPHQMSGDGMWTQLNIILKNGLQ